MKKMTVWILFLIMVLDYACAEIQVPVDVIALPMDRIIKIDLDGDGYMEKVQLFMKDEEYESYLSLLVEGTNGTVNIYDTWIQSPEVCLCIDMNVDGIQEILLSGDVQSDDYITWCLNYDLKNGIREFTFADANRGINTGEYLPEGYGKIISINGNTITLRGSQDVLGTWMADRTFTLENETFELKDDGMWIMQDITENESIWQYFHLNPVREIPVIFDDGSKGFLAVGEKFVITFSDKMNVAGFVTQEGKKGSIAITKNKVDGWGYMINGIADYKYFEYMPYAD